MRAGAHFAEGQRRLGLEYLADPPDLRLERGPPGARRLLEWLDPHLEPLPRAPLLPHAGDDPVDDQRRDIPGPAGRLLGPVRRDLLAREAASEIAIEVREQPNGAGDRGIRAVGAQAQGPVALHVDLLELVAHRVGDLARDRRTEPEPLREVAMGRGAIGAQVAPEHLRESRFRLGRRPRAEPLIGPTVGHLAALIRAEADDAGHAREPETDAPFRPRAAECRDVPLERPRSDARAHLLAERAERQASPIERLADRVDDLVDLPPVESERLEALRLAGVRTSAERRAPHRELARREHVDRAADPVRLHQAPLVPQRRADLAP